ncbi:MAG: type II toxin-antitoxin system VapC family toxin [Spirochaetales bacterium]|nr:type II toxin-antitoxin system VapC family toxin [Spirochaetales bacterium]
MKIVDASALLAILLREPKWREVAELIDINDIAAPESLPMEIGNSLSALVKRNILGVQLAGDVWSAYESIPVRLVKIPYEMAMKIAFTNRIYAYDAYVIAAAKQQRAGLVTLDRQMGKIAEKNGIKVSGV